MPPKGWKKNAPKKQTPDEQSDLVDLMQRLPTQELAAFAAKYLSTPEVRQLATAMRELKGE